jgi:hypothetical protein
MQTLSNQLKIDFKISLTQSNPFSAMTTEWIEKYIVHVKALLVQNHKNYHAPINLKTGKQGKVYKMPWMVELWEKGLKIAEQELSTRK